jgi:hypothetical protein
MKLYYFHIVFLCLLFISNILPAQQNLIRDPSMENYHYIPIGPNPCNADSMLVSSDWYDPNGASSDYIHAYQGNVCNPPVTCCVPENNFGYQWPKDGDAYWHFGSAYLVTPTDTHTQGICTNKTFRQLNCRTSILC